MIIFKYIEYGKCSKNFEHSFFVLLSNKMLVIKAGIHKTLVRIAIRKDPDRTAYSEKV